MNDEGFADDDFRVWVGSLGQDVKQEAFEAFFRARYKSVLKTRVLTDDFGRCRGFGFVSFGQSEDMLHCIKQVNGKNIGSRAVLVKPAECMKTRALQRGKVDEKKKCCKEYSGAI